MRTKEINRKAKLLRDIPEIGLEKDQEFILTSYKIPGLRLSKEYYFGDIKILDKYLNFKSIEIEMANGDKICIGNLVK